MKVTGATSLLELQKLLKERRLDVTVRYSGSAACYVALVVGPRRHDENEAYSARGLGRDLGEAVANAYLNYEKEH